MERVSLKLACFLLLFMAAISLLPSSLMANKVQLFMTGQPCKSHSDCKTNSAYPANFCIDKISGSEIGHCVGSTLALPSETKDEERCGFCESDEDCRDCVPTSGCVKDILPGICA